MKTVCLDCNTVYTPDDARWERFASLGDFEVYDRTDESAIIERCAGADAVLTNKVPLNAATIAQLPSLRYIGVLATGFNIVDTKAAAAAGIAVTNIPSYSNNSVAQHVFALLMAITNRVEDYARMNADGHWCRSLDFSYRLQEWHELAGKTMGVVGLGHIGSAVAAIASAMGMKVAVFTSKPQDALPEVYVKMDLDELFAEADVVSLHCPLADGTRDMVDARRLALMKPSAILINTARGALVDEKALADALNNGKIYAAGLDVLCNEPPKHDCSLVGARNCFITPHIAWASAEARERLFDIAFDNLKAYAEGRVQNRVN